MAMALWLAWARVFVGCAEVMQNADSAGLEVLEKGLAEATSLGAGRLAPLTYSLAAEAYAEIGNTEKAPEYCDGALRETRLHDELPVRIDLNQALDGYVAHNPSGRPRSTPAARGR
jgi:hypothetical protein